MANAEGSPSFPWWALVPLGGALVSRIVDLFVILIFCVRVLR